MFRFHFRAGVYQVEGDVPQVEVLGIEGGFIRIENGLIKEKRKQGTEDEFSALFSHRERQCRLKEQGGAVLVVSVGQVTRVLAILQVEVETGQCPGRVGQLFGNLIGGFFFFGKCGMGQPKEPEHKDSGN